MKTKIYVIRHCEAAGNIERYFQGHTDGLPSPKGEHQCALLGERFKEIPLDAVYTSPLTRARRTAEGVNLYHHLPIQVEEGLIEINGGQWEGKLWAELPKLFPKEARFWSDEPWDYEPEGGESMRAVYDRIWKAVQKLALQHPGQTIAAVSHGCSIRNLLCRLKFDDITRLNEVQWCDNTAVSLIEFDEAGKAELIFENDASHLDAQSSTLSGQDWWKADAPSKFE